MRVPTPTPNTIPARLFSIYAPILAVEIHKSIVGRSLLDKITDLVFPALTSGEKNVCIRYQIMYKWHFITVIDPSRDKRLLMNTNLALFTL